MARLATLFSTFLVLGLVACGGGDAEMDADAGMDAAEDHADMPMGGADAAVMTPGSRMAPEGATVTISSPAEGAEVEGPDVTVTLDAQSITLAIAGELVEGTGHHHLFLDVDSSPAGAPIAVGVDGIVHLGQMQTEHTFTGLTPGAHRIIAVMADGLHFPFEPSVADTVNFTVTGG